MSYKVLLNAEEKKLFLQLFPLLFHVTLANEMHFFNWWCLFDS